ncbi:receptor-type tyrosine-protein phosphatase H-like, partial [Anableps anableps]
RYSFTLFTVFDYARSSGTTITAVTVPPAVPSVDVTERFVDGAILQWEDPKKGWEYELDVDANEVKIIQNNLVSYTVTNLQAGTKYSFRVTTLFSGLRSTPYTGVIVTKIGCDSVSWDVTNSSIRGTVEGLFSHATASNGSATLDSPEGKPIISVAKFPDHYHQMSLDENRGFSQEYESLTPVGTNQTHRAATLPENKGKNRFTNILPYDWSRVKLSTSTPNDTLDYINANYLPGYNSSKEYIACQGPLPSTVNDFWRMVWEQKVKRIVMVTNCVEAGRTKCERYWPEDSDPRRYGEFMVSKTSEDRESNWTLREFRVTHTKDSEERTLKQFHFTAWPDHGVPQGTEVLIHFRKLVRQHIESEGSKAPTVVHCSAGVGRTGTIIALDVLLQQLEREQAVGISNFVHKMRQHRSHMVQTESQYIFLHQCIMDSLQAPANQEENVYENDDLIYVNATALRQLR